MKRLLVVAVLVAAISQEASAILGSNGKQVVCPAGQRLYVGSNHVVSCIKSGSMGATRNMPGQGGSGVQSAASIKAGCARQGLAYMPNRNGGYCYKSGLMGATAQPRLIGGNGGVQHGFGYNGGGEQILKTAGGVQRVGGNGGSF